MSKALIVHIFAENRRMVIIASGLFLLSILLFWIALQMGGTTGRLRLKFQENRRTLQAQSPLDVATQYRQSGEDLKQFTARMPVRSDFPGILGQLLELADSHKLMLGSISYKPRKSAVPGAVSYTITSSATGSYASIKSFLARLQGIDGVTTVESMAIANNDPFEVMATMDFEISINLREGVK